MILIGILILLRINQQIEDQKHKEENDEECINIFIIIVKNKENEKNELDKKIDELRNQINSYNEKLASAKQMQEDSNKYIKIIIFRELENNEGKKKSIMIKLTSYSSDIDRVVQDCAPYESSRNLEVEGGEIEDEETEKGKYNEIKRQLDQLSSSDLPSIADAKELLDNANMRYCSKESEYNEVLL